ncbi:hypothetical protein VTO42DRAFT_8709 [Malbranchea cinnamomea]
MREWMVGVSIEKLFHYGLDLSLTASTRRHRVSNSSRTIPPPNSLYWGHLMSENSSQLLAVPAGGRLRPDIPAFYGCS